MFDTHCHLNFSRFKKNVPEVIERARAVGVNQIVVPGTDIPTSQEAVKIAERYEGVYAAVGIHPHHVYDVKIKAQNSNVPLRPRSLLRKASEASKIEGQIKELEKLVVNPKVVAIGEVGLDKHVYTDTKYHEYTITDEFIELQKKLLQLQLDLALKYKKTIILHNREAKSEMLSLLANNQSLITNNKIVFHCCEPDDELLDFAIKNNVYIGIDGDVTYTAQKQEFVHKIPLELLVLETDSPYLLPEPLRTQKLFPNEPKNILVTLRYISRLLLIDESKLMTIITMNSVRLFGLN